MIDEHLGRPAPLHILFKATVDEVLEVGRPLRLNFRRLILHDVVKNSLLMLLKVRWLTLCKLDSEDTERPDIDLVVVLAETLD